MNTQVKIKTFQLMSTSEETSDPMTNTEVDSMEGNFFNSLLQKSNNKSNNQIIV